MLNQQLKDPADWNRKVKAEKLAKIEAKNLQVLRLFSIILGFS
jgi:hypothetical protein